MRTTNQHVSSLCFSSTHLLCEGGKNCFVPTLFRLYGSTCYLLAFTVNERLVCVLCAQTWVKLRDGDCENRGTDTANETNKEEEGGNKGREIRDKKQKKEDEGGEKSLDIWLLEFNKTLKERKQQKTEVAGK